MPPKPRACQQTTIADSPCRSSLSLLRKRSCWCWLRAEFIGRLSGMSCGIPSARTWSMLNASRMTMMTSLTSWGTIQPINSIFRRREVCSLPQRGRRRWARLPISERNHVTIESSAPPRVGEDSRNLRESIQDDQASPPTCIRACTKVRAKTSWEPTPATSCWKAGLYKCSTKKPKEVHFRRTKG